MPVRIGEEERQSARAVPAQPSGLGLRRAISALFVVDDALRHRLLLTP